MIARARERLPRNTPDNPCPTQRATYLPSCSPSPLSMAKEDEALLLHAAIRRANSPVKILYLERASGVKKVRRG